MPTQWIETSRSGRPSGSGFFLIQLVKPSWQLNSVGKLGVGEALAIAQAEAQKITGRLRTRLRLVENIPTCQADDSCAAPSSQVGMIALAGSASARACTTERPSSG